MEYISGNIHVRVPQEAMHAGQVILGHRHNFDHTTYIQKGSVEVSLLKATRVDELDRPLDAEAEITRVIHCTDVQNWFLILAGRFHLIRALEEGTVYHCIYSHREPQALVLSGPDMARSKPMHRRDDDGTLWLRVDEKVVQSTSEWADAYR